VIARALAAGHQPRSVLVLDKWLDDVLRLFDGYDVPIYVGDADLLQSLTGFNVHRGALAAMHRPRLAPVDELVAGAHLLVVLEDIVDHTNVGAIFRSVAALGADAVLVTPRCADPLYRRSVRVSMGTVLQVPWTRLPEWDAADLSSLKYVYGKSAFARHPSVKGDPDWNFPVGYGLSETCAAFASHYCDDPRELLRQSTGRLLPGNRLRVVDPDTGRLLGPGESGELAVAGPTLMEHYVGKTPEECLDPDGFFHTGDAGWFDEAGFLHWTGRRSEMIKTGGANVSPAEIEVALRAFGPAKLARVIGRPDARLGEIAVLCLVLRDGETASTEDVRSFLRERLASYKVPKEILFLADGEVPMTSSDTKVRDEELRRIIDARLEAKSSTTTGEHRDDHQ